MSTETGAQKTGRTKRNKVKIFGREYQTNEVLIFGKRMVLTSLLASSGWTMRKMGD